MHITHKEEDYIRSIAQISNWSEKTVSTNQLAEVLKTSPAAITDMLKKLSEKGLVKYIKYQGVSLSKEGNKHARQIVRKQRLWQYFLVNNLKFGLDDISEISEQMEHIESPMLIQRLDDHLGNPTYSPFGEPIPNKDGVFVDKSPVALSNLKEGVSTIVSAVKENNPTLMQYLHKKGIYVGAQIIVIEIMSFDDSRDISIDSQQKVNISNKVAENILVSS